MFSLCLGVGDFLGLLIKAFDFHSPHTLTSPRILRFDINLRELEIISHGGKKSELCKLFVKCIESKRNISLNVVGVGQSLCLSTEYLHALLQIYGFD